MTTQTQNIDPASIAKHRTMWALGDYPAVATDLVSPLGPVLVEATAIGPADRVLDVAAGTGSVAIPAAQTGAKVVASDLTPQLLDRGKTVAAAQGVRLEWCEANAEELPFADNEFDAVVSSIGVMFAPHHQLAADELVRVCKPAGRIGVISWTPEGFIGQMFAAMKPYVPAPPPGVQPPPLWGSEEHVRGLLSDRVDDFSARRGELEVGYFPTGAAFRDYFKANYGPTITAYRANENDPSRVFALDAELAALGDRFLGGTPSMRWEYLLVTARKR